MNYITAIVLSIIEGITEFLPVSSTGHLILASKLLNIPSTEFTKSFEIFIQLGAIMAVTTLYWHTLLTNKKLWLPLIIAFIPTAIVGLTLYPFIKEYLLGNTLVTTISLGIGGLILLGFEKWNISNSRFRKISKNSSGITLSIKQAFAIGLCQSISVIPGVSRAAATILGGLFMGLSRNEAVEFSFLLALPTMAAATGLDLVKSADIFTSNNIFLLAVGFVGSWITAYFTVKAFLAFIKTRTLTAFGVYRVILALSFWWLVGVS